MAVGVRAGSPEALNVASTDVVPASFNPAQENPTVRLIDLNRDLAETNESLNRLAAQIAGLPSWRRGSREHMALSGERQALLRKREELRRQRQELFARN
jgi:hypothetical protein